MSNSKSPANTPQLVGKWTRARQPAAQWLDADEFLDTIYWLRTVFSLLLGILWGIVPLSGATGLFAYAAVSVAAVYAYSYMLHSVDLEEDFGESARSMPLKEGAASGAATFLAAWILAYTWLHPEHV